jgi:hypothetical protein
MAIKVNPGVHLVVKDYELTYGIADIISKGSCRS